MPKKKPNKEQRMKARAERADIFNDGFKMGFEMGHKQGLQDAKTKEREEHATKRTRTSRYAI